MRKTEKIIIEVEYEISYEEGKRDDAIKAAEQVPSGITGAGYKAEQIPYEKPKNKYYCNRIGKIKNSG
tara:strand:+ start:295 stop:498 length:204 start_codon:yes stop_codon:yes gene_type:complete